MKLSELFLNRWLYKDSKQNLETKDSVFNSLDNSDAEPTPIASGGAAQDINTSNVYINGQVIEPGSYVLTVGDWGWGQTCVFSSTDLNTVSWTSGVFNTASGTPYSISGGNTGNMAAKTYIYLDILVSTTAYQTTTTPANSVGVGKVLVAVANPDTSTATFNLSEATQLIGDNILANSINASKIVAGSITATQISSSYIYAGTIVASQITSGTIDASVITVTNLDADEITTGSLSGIYLSIGSGNAIFKANASGISLGNATFASAPFRVNMAGEVTATKITISTNDSSYTGSPIAEAYIGDLTASKITSGTIIIGGTNQPGLLTIIESSSAGSGTTTAKLNWKSSGGTERGKIWADSSGYMGYNAIGGRQYFYCADEQVMLLQSGSNRTIFYKNVGLNGTYLYFTSGTTASILGTTSLMEYNAQTYHYWNVAGSEEMKLSGTGLTLQGYLYQPNSEIMYLGAYTLDMNGTSKTAIVPTKEGFNALYAVESPDVWFMDFCDEKGILDPMFLEVTVGPYRYIKCEDSGYQVWGKRKGHEKNRFESKDIEDFKANERFLNIPKRGLPLKKVVDSLPKA